MIGSDQTDLPGGLKPGLLSTSGGASYLSMSRARLYQLMDSGAVPYVFVGRRRMLLPADLDAFIEKVRSGEIDGKALANSRTKESA